MYSVVKRTRHSVEPSCLYGIDIDLFPFIVYDHNVYDAYTLGSVVAVCRYKCDADTLAKVNK